MNVKQRWVIGIATILLVVSGLFPPWTCEKSAEGPVAAEVGGFSNGPCFCALVGFAWLQHEWREGSVQEAISSSLTRVRPTGYAFLFTPPREGAIPMGHLEIPNPRKPAKYMPRPIDANKSR